MHSYRTRWSHERHLCWESLFLKNRILDVPWGFKEYNDTGAKVKNSYDSLAHMWLEWYQPYFLDSRYNQTPRLMVRHEDLVYRPEKVISKICDCVGGTNMMNKNWSEPGGFEYEEESANRGGGHGKHRSGLLTAVIKYGQPLEDWYSQFNAKDRKIMREAFQGETVDPESQKIFEAFKYQLYDDVSEPTQKEKQRNRLRYERKLDANTTLLQYRQWKKAAKKLIP